MGGGYNPGGNKPYKTKPNPNGRRERRPYVYKDLDAPE